MEWQPQVPVLQQCGFTSPNCSKLWGDKTSEQTKLAKLRTHLPIKWLSPKSWIEPIRAQNDSLWHGLNSSRFTCEMVDFEWQIGHELLIYRNYPCHLFNSTFSDVQTSAANWFDPSTGRFSKKFLSFLTQNRPEMNEALCRYVNRALMQSNMSNLIQISKSCSRVIQRTLRSGANWLTYSSFSAISLVKCSNLQACVALFY